MEKDMQKLASAIRLVRKQKELNQEQLGNLVGVKKSQISKIEVNPQDMKFTTIMKIVKALNIEVVLTSEGVTVKSVL